MSKNSQILHRRLQEARERTDFLFTLLKPESLYERAIPERHRLVFYLGHLEAFDWNLIGRGCERPSFHPAFDRLFAFGIDPVNGQLPADRPQDWPCELEIRGYNRRVRAEIDRLLEGKHWLLSDGTLAEVAIEHRLMHAETLVYLLHELPAHYKNAPMQTAEPARAKGYSVAKSVRIPEGIATLGLERNGGAHFGWDNEFEVSRVHVPAFSVDIFPVTNRQFMDFVRAGGYEEKAFWSGPDWDWKNAAGLQHPHFWRKEGDAWRFRGVFGPMTSQESCPVYVSHAEASAYAHWAGKSLPTEEQWHRAAYGTPEGNEHAFPWGNSLPAARRGNFNFARWHPCAVGAFPEGASAFGVLDLLGNGWEWTSTAFQPLPGFQAFPFYPGYSANFFDGQHYVLKGGSPQTAACMLRRSFRNWFQPHYQYIYATFRCVEN